ncbi:hypothetical protein OS493_032674 [Desmophyllum pertusum]|uniref:Uncharacterized protein n=1 Tax=Desmophyllum pertusum TaxID=174260 RepID=A0A9X0CD03_9CNID|nr:hypothetical protein OS493_032674 [Desmophyllum pertusum]
MLTKGAIAVARSMIPGALSAVDKTMKETFMRFAKSSGGFSGLYSKFGAYQKWCRTTSARAQFYERTLEMVDLITDPDNPRTGRHRELEKAEITKSEQAVLRVIDAVKELHRSVHHRGEGQALLLGFRCPCSPRCRGGCASSRNCWQGS